MTILRCHSILRRHHLRHIAGPKRWRRRETLRQRHLSILKAGLHHGQRSLLFHLALSYKSKHHRRAKHAKHNTRRRRREENSDRQPIEEAADRTPAGTAAVDATHDIHQLLANLDEEDRALVLMRFGEGHDYEELAGMFDTTAGACRMRISRIREKLASRAGRLFGEPIDAKG
jgi:RNA polymerase sigma factor (sigma-70 family)